MIYTVAICIQINRLHSTTWIRIFLQLALEGTFQVLHFITQENNNFLPDLGIYCSLPFQLQLPGIVLQTENNIKKEYSDQNFQLRIYYSVCFTFYNYNRSWQDLFVSLNPTLCSLPKSKLNHLRQMVVWPSCEYI